MDTLHALIATQSVENIILLATDDTASYLNSIGNTHTLIPVEAGKDYVYYSTSSQEIIPPLKFTIMSGSGIDTYSSGSHNLDYTINLNIVSIEDLYTTTEYTSSQVSLSNISSGSNNLHISLSVVLDDSILQDPWGLFAGKIIDSNGFEYNDFKIT